MASTRRNQATLLVKVSAVTLAFLILVTTLPSISESALALESSSNIMRTSRVLLGSRPPRCENRCLSCRPCKATLVVPPHRNRGFQSHSLTYHGDDSSYYLLAWKCKCGNQFFQP